MVVFSSIEEARGALAGCAVAIGNFDGVHLGHKRLLDEARRLAREEGAKAVLLTFEPHPAKVLSPSFAPFLLTTLERKLALLEEQGLDAVVLQPFDRAYAATSAETFVERDLIGALGARHVVVGYDFTFGKGRAGNPEALAKLSEGKALVHTVQAVSVGGLVVSSTKIRELLLEGRVSQAAQLLGRAFVLDGKVVAGRGRGKGLGFPTANLAPETELVPAAGVYAVVAAVEGIDAPVGGAANIGRKPTFGEEELTVESFLFDLDADLYGRRMAVAFLERLRPELRFGSVAELVEQIGKDVVRAKEIVSDWVGKAPILPRPLR
jgi:riboflavin kinase/FMN adenylyltransferase